MTTDRERQASENGEAALRERLERQSARLSALRVLWFSLQLAQLTLAMTPLKILAVLPAFLSGTVMAFLVLAPRIPTDQCPRCCGEKVLWRPGVVVSFLTFPEVCSFCNGTGRRPSDGGET
jgi:hypothetical protein